MRTNHHLTTLLLTLLQTPLVSSACSGGGGKPFDNAVTVATTAAGSCDLGGFDAEQQLKGYAASACNGPQAAWAALSSASIAGYAGRCHCVRTYYDNARTLNDVAVWVTCVTPFNALIIASARASNDYLTSHASQIFASCSVCADAQYPSISEKLEMVQTVVEVVLDWKGELFNAEVGWLEEGIRSVVASAALGTGGIDGTNAPTANWIASQITQGYRPAAGSTNNQRRGELVTRQSNSTDPATQPISELIGIKVTVLMIPVNGSIAALQQQLMNSFANATFKESLVPWKANVTRVEHKAIMGDPYANSTGTAGTNASASGTAATASSTGKNAAARSGCVAWGLMVTVVVGCFVYLS